MCFAQRTSSAVSLLALSKLLSLSADFVSFVCVSLSPADEGLVHEHKGTHEHAEAHE